MGTKFMITWNEIDDNDFNTRRTTSHFIDMDIRNCTDDVLEDLKEIADTITRTEGHAGDCIVKDASGRIVLSRAVRFGPIYDEDKSVNNDILMLSDVIWFEDWKEGDIVNA